MNDSYKTVLTGRTGGSFFEALDGKNIYENPQGRLNGLGQTVGMWLVDRNTAFRERATKASDPDERVLYRVSPDGKTPVWTTLNSGGDSVTCGVGQNCSRRPSAGELFMGVRLRGAASTAVAHEPFKGPNG